MARIAGVNIPTQKRVHIALTYIYGIGNTTALKLCSDLKIPSERRVKDLTEDEIIKIRETIDANHQVEGVLRSLVATNIKTLMDLACLEAWDIDPNYLLEVKIHIIMLAQEGVNHLQLLIRKKYSLLWLHKRK